MKEDVDDIEVQNHGSHNVVIDIYLITLASHDQLSIEKEVEAEEDDTEKGKDEVHCSSCEDEEEGKNEHKGETNNEENRSADGEVTLGGKCVDSNANNHTSSANRSSCNNLRLILSGDETDHI